MYGWTPWSDEKWHGRFGIHGIATFHLFPRQNWKRWGYKNTEGWKSVDFGPFFAVCWGDDRNTNGL